MASRLEAMAVPSFEAFQFQGIALCLRFGLKSVGVWGVWGVWFLEKNQSISMGLAYWTPHGLLDPNLGKYASPMECL